MRKLFFYLTMPLRLDYWLMNHPFNKEWDNKLKSLISNYEFENIDRYTSDLNGNRIWIENHPYASFNEVVELNDNITIKVRPSRYTIYIANKKLKKAIYQLKINAFKQLSL